MKPKYFNFVIFKVITLFSLLCRPAHAQFKLVNVGHVNDGGEASGITLSGTNLFLANGTDGLRIYDISSPANPVGIAHTNDGPNALGVALAAGHAYLADGLGGVINYDISNLSSIINVASDYGDFPYWNVSISNNLAFCAYDAYGVLIYDVSQPSLTFMFFVGYTGFDQPEYGASYDTVASGNFLYVANGPDGLRVYDVTDPTQPIDVAYFSNTNTSGSANGLAISGNYLYLANGQDGCRVFDISDPTNLVLISHFNDGSYAYNVTVSDGYLYLVDYFAGLFVYDVSNPANPVKVTSVPISQYGASATAMNAAVLGDFVFLADDADGLRIYRKLPELGLSFSTNGQVILSWPLLVSSFSPQQSPNPNGPWESITNQPVIVENQNQLSLPLESTNRFYRLISAP